MKPSDFKHIVKESLREAFYTKKVTINESTEYMWVGIVDSYGAVHAQQLSFEDWSHHNVLFPTIRGDRWRFDCGDDEIIWTNEPTNDSVISVENFLLKKGEHPKIKSELNESLFKPKRLTVRKDGDIKLGILSKNTIPNEKEYRVSCFVKGTDGNLEAQGHIELSGQEAEELFQNNKFPDDVIRQYDGKISLIDLNGWPKQDDINENLLLLENSSREIDLWLENRRPI